MPPHETYIESHLGGGALMKRKPPALRNIGIDLNERALQQFECPYPVERVHGCAHQFLSDFEYRGRELIYCDPPYLHATRSGERRYRFEYEPRDHLELLQLLKTLPCQVILSGYPSTLYDECLAGWQSLELQVMNQAAGAHREGLVQLHPRSGALDALRGERPHRPAAHQAQGRELGRALSGPAAGGAPGGALGADGRRGRRVTQRRAERQ